MNTKWKPMPRANKYIIGAHYLDWLEKPFILSKAIKAVVSDFSVKVVGQQMGELLKDEVQALKCEESTALIRQTYLLGDGDPFVFARVCIPQSTLEAFKDDFENLGNRPIGETLLYNNPRVFRGEFQVKLVSMMDPMLKDATLHDNAFFTHVWARRSTFNMEGHMLLVTEAFLPKIPSYYKNFSTQLNG